MPSKTLNIFKGLTLVTVPITTACIGTYYYRKDKVRPILAFDLDHTLIHACSEKSMQKRNYTPFLRHDAQISIKNDNDTIKYYVWYRPFAKFTIKLLSNFCTLHLYTSATQSYADAILREMKLDSHFDKKFYRDSWNAHGCKDLSMIDGKAGDKLLVDDLNSNCCAIAHKNNNDNDKKTINEENPISSFYHIPQYMLQNKYDFEMLRFLFKWGFYIDRE